ncbi:uncharacterized protein LOC129891794 [Solanum dulcamara]|uniref:uncharacterized protein LOC129891794 n=1 Tax=Solanum dulcamara TaxID=45834 RepID=UPI0024853DF9|nr:uncharacterized protein LOC129891794 [Solanum dulcamara]
MEKILRSLTPKYNYVVCSIEESKDIDALSLDEFQSSLLVHEQKMNKDSTVQEQALKASTNTHSNNYRGRGRGRGRTRGRGDRGGRDFKVNTDQFQGKDRGRIMTNPRYNAIDVTDLIIMHQIVILDCLNDKEKEENVNFVKNKKVETLLMVVQDGIKHESNIWFIDTRFSNHMCGSKFSFSSLNENFHSTVAFGDCSTIEVMGKGDIKIKTNNDFVETISNVLYVPDLKNNLLSADQL